MKLKTTRSWLRSYLLQCFEAQYNVIALRVNERRRAVGCLIDGMMTMRMRLRAHAFSALRVRLRSLRVRCVACVV